ncbi:hypothetical protein ACFFMR_32655 [Micromonospora andamanensis]|uniref:Uncharacterized protein n=1 Tax=Micromonospora andamanensis TaxID=1287068 RepID=A0ABQ4I241_9ACTN|nr:hypothetical protein [Micromonospora andamanensis]GIJ11964.1 hypothetical protein Van01_51780 [Micromonospora andamanensis]
MSNEDLDLLVDPALAARLRGTLNAVAATITDVAPVHEAPQHVPAQPATVVGTRRGWRRRGLAIGLAAAVVPVAAFSALAIGPGDVDQIPPRDAFVTGSADDERYWLVPSFHRDACGNTFGGAELVMESNNIVGKEWNTASVAYGEAPKDGAPGSGCYVSEESQWLTDPGRVGKLSQRLGGKDQDGDWITLIAVHPTVTTLRVAEDARATRDVRTQPLPDRPGGPRYAVFTTPARNPKVNLSVHLLTADSQPAAEPLEIVLPNR